MNFFNRNKTLKPMKSQGNSKNDGLSKVAQHTLATLGSGSMLMAVKLPKGEELNEWLAANTVDFFNELSMLYGTISEYCTNSSCPVMNAGDSVKYLWADGKKVVKPIECSAPEYVDYLLSWVESQLNDETIFPIKFDSTYPKKFHSICATIYKRFFRIYAHIYHAHYKQIQTLGADAHLNTCFKHFIYFCAEFDLVEKKELAPLQTLIDSMLGSDKAKLEKPSIDTNAAASASAASAASPKASPIPIDDEVVRG